LLLRRAFLFNDEQIVVTQSNSHPVDPTDELCERLAIASLLLTGDIAAIAPAVCASFASHLPQMEPPEDDILRMLLFERQPIQQIAASLQLSKTDALGCAALGVVRLLADMPLLDMRILVAAGS
jgi:hypothetical protein